MRDEIELYWRIYTENCTQGRHHESMRATLTTLIAAIAAGALGLLKTDVPSCQQMPLGILVVILGLFGAFASRKHYERFALHMRRASMYRNKIDHLLRGLNLAALKREADAKHVKSFALTGRVSLAWLWSLMNLAVAAIGFGAVWFIQKSQSCW